MAHAHLLAVVRALADQAFANVEAALADGGGFHSVACSKFELLTVQYIQGADLALQGRCQVADNILAQCINFLDALQHTAKLCLTVLESAIRFDPCSLGNQFAAHGFQRCQQGTKFVLPAGLNGSVPVASTQRAGAIHRTLQPASQIACQQHQYQGQCCHYQQHDHRRNQSGLTDMLVQSGLQLIAYAGKQGFGFVNLFAHNAVQSLSLFQADISLLLAQGVKGLNVGAQRALHLCQGLEVQITENELAAQVRQGGHKAAVVGVAAAQHKILFVAPDQQKRCIKRGLVLNHLLHIVGCLTQCPVQSAFMVEADIALLRRQSLEAVPVGQHRRFQRGQHGVVQRHILHLRTQ